jgi:hypothetical protein
MSIVNDLRELADFLETRPALTEHYTTFQPSIYSHFFSSDKKEMAACLREFGECEKKSGSATGGSMVLTKHFGDLSLKLELYGVCRKVTKTVEAEVWECPSVLELAAEAEGQAVNGSR